MRRREFITVLGGVAAWPLAARAQQQKLPTIGFLGVSTPSGWSHYVTAFGQRLRELGWIEGRTVAIEIRWAEGRGERFAEIAAEFVRNNVDIIVTGGGAVIAAKQATSIILSLLKTPNRGENLEIFTSPPYRRGHDHDSFGPGFPALLPCS